MSSAGKLGVKGVKSSGNELTLPAGSTTQADHCVIPSRDVLRPRRGQSPTSLYVDDDATDANANRAKEMYQWGNALLVNYTGGGGYRLSSFDDPFGLATYANVGSYAPPDPTVMRMKFAELAKSVYWTTDTGLATLDVIGGTARAAGYRPPAIWMADGVSFTQLSGNPNATGSWFAKNQAVAYRATVGRKDANGVIKLSAASGRVVVVNPNDVAVAIGGLVRNANVVTATVTAHKFREGDILDLTLTGGDIGNFDATANVVTSVTATTIVWAETAANYTSVATATIVSGTKSVQVVVAPNGVAFVAGDIVQLYRTDESAGEAIDPGDECYLAYERLVTAADVSTGYVTIADTTPSSFLGDPLDSNDNDGEGPLGVNTLPPLCRDLCTWDGKLWGFHTTDLHRLRLRLLGTDSPNGLQSGDLIAVNTRVFEAGANFRLYTQYLPTENVARTTYDLATYATGSLIGIVASHGFDGDTGLGLVNLEQLTLASTMADTGGAINAIYAATSRTSAFGDALATTKAITSASTARVGSTVTVRCTGHGFTQGQVVMIARAVTGAADANFTLGLKTVASVVDADNFTYTESGSAVTLTGATRYAYATTYKSDDNKQPVRFSRPGLPEAWPLPNTIGGLPDGGEVLRGHPTPDGGELLLCFKAGDIYAIGGQYPYTVRRVDGSAQLFAADSLKEHANQLHALTTQGPATIGSNGVGVFGGDIEDEWRVIINDITTYGAERSTIWGMSYESDRQYHLWVPSSGGDYANRAYLWHSMASGWTRWPALYRNCGLVFRGYDTLILGDAVSNALLVEQKLLGASLYISASDGVGITTANGAQNNVTTINVATTTNALGAGDLVRISGTYYRVISATATAITIGTSVSVTNGQSIVYYRRFSPAVTFAIESGSMPGIEKKFREVQLFFGRRHFETMTVTFKNEHSDTATATVSVTPNDFVLNTQINRPTTLRVEVPQAMRSAGMLTITISTDEARGFFDLLGYAATFEPISERTGK